MILSIKHLSIHFAAVVFLAVSVAFPAQCLSSSAIGGTVLSQWMKAKDIKNNTPPASTADAAQQPDAQQAAEPKRNPAEIRKRPAAPAENPTPVEPPGENVGQAEPPPQFEPPPQNPSLPSVPAAEYPSQPETQVGNPNPEEPPPAPEEQNQPEPAAENPDQNENPAEAAQKE